MLRIGSAQVKNAPDVLRALDVVSHSGIIVPRDDILDVAGSELRNRAEIGVKILIERDALRHGSVCLQGVSGHSGLRLPVVPAYAVAVMSRGVQHRKSVPQRLPVPKNTIRLHTAQVALGRRAEAGVLCPDAHGVRRRVSQCRGGLLDAGGSDLRRKLLYPGMAADVVAVAVRADEPVDVSQPQPKLRQCGAYHPVNHVCARAAVYEAKFLAPYQRHPAPHGWERRLEQKYSVLNLAKVFHIVSQPSIFSMYP